MADLPHRQSHEDKLAATIAAILARNQAEWEQSPVPAKTERELREELLALLILLFGLGANSAAGELGIGLVVSGGADAWARENAGGLARRIVVSNGNRLRAARLVDSVNNPGLNTMFNQVVESIIIPKTWLNRSATEVTRAYTAGGEYTAAIYNIGRLQPVPMRDFLFVDLSKPKEPQSPAEPPSDRIQLSEPAVAIWSTERDRKVCPLCKPLDGEPREVWSGSFPLGPPAHDVCRCWLSYATGEQA